MTGVINNFGGFYQTEYYVHEARMCGAKIEAPCVNHSRNLTHIYGKTIYLGFIHMANLERKLALTIVAERENKGDFRDLKDFINRVEVSREQLEILIRIGAFRFTGLNKYQLMWEKNAVYNPMIKHIPVASLFEADTEHFDLPMLEEGKYEQAFDEIEILGFPLCSPFALVNADAKPDILAADMRKYYDKTVVMMGYYVTRKDVTTVNRKLMNFGTWLDEEGMFFDTTHFPPSLAQYPFRGKGVYLLKGKIVDDFGFPSMEVVWMDKLPFVKDERY